MLDDQRIILHQMVCRNSYVHVFKEDMKKMKATEGSVSAKLNRFYWPIALHCKVPLAYRPRNYCLIANCVQILLCIVSHQAVHFLIPL